MTVSELNEQLQLRVIEYLYGELSAAEKTRFEQELSDNPALQQALEAEQRLNSALPLGAMPQIDAERVQGNRWLLRQNLQKATRRQFSLLEWLREHPVIVTAQAAALALSFVLGLFVAGPAAVNPGPAPVPGALVAETSPLDFIAEGDYEIYQLRVNEYDAVSGNIDLSFSLASESRLTGNVSDQGVHQLMAVALQDDIGSAARLDTINALQPVRAGNDVYEALISVLMTDENPGVRYQAVTALADLADRDRVREALRSALRRDMNQGVRVEAFNALMNYRDDQTLDLFREQMESDSNEYIRARARSIVEEAQGANDTI